MALLAVEDVTRRFGGIVALADVSLALDQGEIVGLIGPNGAGKTTLFNLITRLYRPNSGRILFDGKGLTRTPAYRIVRLGIARTFQNVVLFQNMTVLENLLVGAHSQLRPFSERRGRKQAEQMLEYLQLGDFGERRQFGKTISSFQLVQELLADMSVELEAARLLTWRAALLADSGQRHTFESSVAKYYSSEVSVRAANAAVQVHGGYGYVDEYPVGKYLRDARVTTLYEGTSQIQKLIIGRALTGESAFT
jgi:alkylation response protein AidB-like acyl-CoA dehydrogenase